MEYLFAVYSGFSFSHSEVDILLQTQSLSLNFDAKIYISAVRSQNGIEQPLRQSSPPEHTKKEKPNLSYLFFERLNR